MKPFVKDALVMLNAVGLNPKNPNIIRSITTLLLTFWILVQIGTDLMLNKKPNNFIDAGADFAGIWQDFCKLLLLQTKIGDLAEILDQMENFWSPWKFGSVLMEVLRKKSNLLRKVVIALKVSYWAAITLYICKPFLIGSKSLPLPCGVCSIDDNIVFGLVYVSQSIAAVSICFYIIGFDILLACFVSNADCQLDLLKAGFVQLSTDMDSSGNHRKCIREVETLVKHHNNILRFLSGVKNCYSFFFLNHVLTCAFCLCWGLLILSMNGSTWSLMETIKYMTYLIAFMGETFFYCLAGSFILTKSESVAHAAYDTKWWAKTQPQLRKSLSLVILRGQKGAKLTAGNIIDVDLNTYTNIITKGCSLFTLVQTLYSDKGTKP